VEVARHSCVGVLLAESVNADAYLIRTDTDAVFENWGQPDQPAIKQCSPEALLGYTFAPGD